MKISSQLKLLNDEYEGFYSCGLTMFNNRSMNRFKTVKDTEKETVLESEDGLIFTVEKTKDEVTDALHICTSVENKGNDPVTLEMLDTFVISEIEGDKLHRFTSFWSAEGRHKVDELCDLNLEHAWNHMAYRVEKFGNTGSMPVRRYFPFAAIEDSKTGRFTAVQIYSPASWQIEVIIRKDDKVTLAGGLADRDFGHWTKKLYPGETYNAPKAVLAQGDSLEEACDKLVKSQHPNVSPVDDKMGVSFNEYCATWGDPDEGKMMRLADKLYGHGIQYLVMDSGWYLDRGAYWWEHRGEWTVNKDRFPNGLKPVSDYIRSKGMIPGIWYEFETISDHCPIFNDEDMLLSKDGSPLTIAGARFLDLEKEKAWNFLKESVIDQLKDNDFGYIKVDYNDSLGIGCDGPDGMGENLRRKILKTQEFFKLMRTEIPDLVIENCSSGGHRLEPSMMEISSMASFSDAHEIVSIPLIAANLLYLVRPDQNQIWSVLRASDSIDRLHYSMCATLFGRMGLSGDVYDMSDEQWAIVDEGISFYKKVADVIKNGTLKLRIAEPKYYNDPEGGQLVIREYGKRTLLVYHRFKNSVSLSEFLKNHNVDLPKGNKTVYGAAEADFSAVSIEFA